MHTIYYQNDVKIRDNVPQQSQPYNPCSKNPRLGARRWGASLPRQMAWQQARMMVGFPTPICFEKYFCYVGIMENDR